MYNSLIRSVFDYSFFNINSLAEGTFNKLQVMQNCALRSIFKNWDRGGVTEILHAQANLPKVEERMLVLGNQYLKKCGLRNNPLICPLIDEFKLILGNQSFGHIKFECPLAFFDMP